MISLQRLTWHSASSSSVPSQFLITYTIGGTGHKKRSDPSGYVTPGGNGTSNCVQSPILSLTSNGVLSASDGSVYGTNYGVVWKPFVSSNSPQDITTLWEFVGGTLKWDNVLFNSGSASFCLDSSNNIDVYFLAPLPASCTQIFFSIAPCK